MSMAAYGNYRPCHAQIPTGERNPGNMAIPADPHETALRDPTRTPIKKSPLREPSHGLTMFRTPHTPRGGVGTSFNNTKPVFFALNGAEVASKIPPTAIAGLAAVALETRPGTGCHTRGPKER